MKHKFYYWSAEISKDVCEDIIDTANKYEFIDGGTKDNNENNLRSSRIKWLSPNENKITSLISYYTNMANRLSFGVQTVPYINDIQFTEYNGQYNQKYDWHIDLEMDSNIELDRKLSFILQLTDPKEYEGGDFELVDSNIPEHFKQQGSIIVFPSFLSHRITPVTKGTRHSLVSWIEGPKWR